MVVDSIIMFTGIKKLFTFGLCKDTPFAIFVFIMMQLVCIWSICGLTFASKTTSDIVMNIFQLICYILFMLSSYHRMKDHKETERLISLIKNNKKNG